LGQASVVIFLSPVGWDGSGNVAHHGGKLDCPQTAPQKGEQWSGGCSYCRRRFSVWGTAQTDSQKGMGIITTALVAGGLLKSFAVPYWVINLLPLGDGRRDHGRGWRIIKTMVQRITKADSLLADSQPKLLAAHLGDERGLWYNRSDHATITGAIVGVGASRRLTAVRWGITRRILWAWVLTIPGAALIGTIVFHLVKILLPSTA